MELLGLLMFSTLDPGADIFYSHFMTNAKPKRKPADPLLKSRRAPPRRRIQEELVSADIISDVCS